MLTTKKCITLSNLISLDTNKSLSHSSSKRGNCSITNLKTGGEKKSVPFSISAESQMEELSTQRNAECRYFASSCCSMQWICQHKSEFSALTVLKSRWWLGKVWYVLFFSYRRPYHWSSWAMIPNLSGHAIQVGLVETTWVHLIVT